MDLDKAIKTAQENGGYITRKKGNLFYKVSDTDLDYITVFSWFPGFLFNVGSWTPSVEELLAKDWEEAHV